MMGAHARIGRMRCPGGPDEESSTMKRRSAVLACLVIAFGVSACGPDTLTAAATAAATEAAAAKQAEAQKAALEVNLKAAQDATMKQAADAGDQADKAAR
jgi:hypothetical protein